MSESASSIHSGTGSLPSASPSHSGSTAIGDAIGCLAYNARQRTDHACRSVRAYRTTEESDTCSSTWLRRAGSAFSIG